MAFLSTNPRRYLTFTSTTSPSGLWVVLIHEMVLPAESPDDILSRARPRKMTSDAGQLGAVPSVESHLLQKGLENGLQQTNVRDHVIR